MREKHLGLLLWGSYGTGKSYMAAAIANALIDKEVSVQMRNLSLYMNAGFEERNRLLKEVSVPELLIIDDFGSERGTEFGYEIAFNVIDERYRSGKPMIITTNIPLHVFTNPKPEDKNGKVYSRIVERCVPVLFSGNDLRLKIGNKNLQHIKELFKEDNV